MYKFVFLDGRPAYDVQLLREQPMGGVQTGTILLSEALARRGHKVIIYNDRPMSYQENGVYYEPVSAVSHLGKDDIVITNNSLSILDKAGESKKVVWARNNIGPDRIGRDHGWKVLFRYRPNIVFPSKFAAGRTPWFLPFRSRLVIEHGLDQSFTRFGGNGDVPPPVAIFASQPSRNLKRVVRAWQEIIHPQLSQAKLHIYYPKEKLYPKHLEGMENVGIEIKGSVGKAALAKAMSEARVMIYPGHRTETFCNVAAEALATGLPITTMGIGALKERVRHGVDGLVSWGTLQMGRNALKILTDDALWLKLRKNAVEGSQNKGWDVRAAEWEQAAAKW